MHVYGKFEADKVKLTPMSTCVEAREGKLSVHPDDARLNLCIIIDHTLSERHGCASVL